MHWKWKKVYVTRNGKTRLLHIPDAETKEYLKKEWKKLDTKFGLTKIIRNPFSHGFIPGRNIATNASVHVGKKYVVTMDIKDFFASIDMYKFRHLYRKNEQLKDFVFSPEFFFFFVFNPESGKYCLPQGSPVSPHLANLYLVVFDWNAAMLAGRYGFSYTRYVDNITISGNNKKKLLEVAERLKRKLKRRYGLEVRYIKVMPYWKQQKVCGVVVNEKLNIDRKYRNTLRALLHKLERGELPEEEVERVLGMKAFVDMVRRERRKGVDSGVVYPIMKFKRMMRK